MLRTHVEWCVRRIRAWPLLLLMSMRLGVYYADSNREPDEDPYTYGDENRNPDRDEDVDAYSYAHSYSYPDSHAHAYPYALAYANCDADAHSFPESHVPVPNSVLLR